MSFQNTFIELIKSKIPEHISLVDELAELLSVSKDSAYRRLRNETPLSLDESVKICLHFDISPAALLDEATELIPFKYNKLYDDHNGFLSYLKNMTATLNAVGKAGGEIFYAAEDIPLFHHFNYPHLSAFKLFYWNKAVLNSEMYVGKSFSLELIHPDVQNAAQELNSAYMRVKSTEIWTTESINSNLRQIEYFADSFQFENKEDALAVTRQIGQLISDLELKAEASSKMPSDPYNKDNYQLYDSEVLIGNNSILIEGLDKPAVFLSHNTFNSLSTRDASFYAETKKWMQNLIKKSSLISGVGEKHRKLFFIKLQKEVQTTIQRIELMDF